MCCIHKKGANKEKYRLFNIPKNLAGNDTGSLEHAISEDLNIMKIKKQNQIYC